MSNAQSNRSAGSQPTTPAALGSVPPAAPGSANATALGCLVLVARQHGLHLTVPQLVHDNLLGPGELDVSVIVRCAKGVGLKTKVVHLGWSALHHLRKVLPAIVGLKNGSFLVLRRLDGDKDDAKVVLQDPNADEDAPLVIDRVRFEEAWTGEIILVKRNYDICRRDATVQHRARRRAAFSRALDRPRRRDLRAGSGIACAGANHVLAGAVATRSSITRRSTRSS